MIVKNEELTIRRCLESLQGIADEIIVVDTGSTDKTMEIVQSFGCTIIQHEWQNDFSSARNAGITQAKGDWILVIDADEFVERLDREKFFQFLKATDAEGVFITVNSLMGPLAHPSNIFAIRVMRLFRKGHLYSGAIHEQVADSVFRTKRPIAKYDLILTHLGYTNEFVAMRAKTKRNTQLIEQMIEENPNDLFQITNLMAEYSISGQHTQCATLSEKTWNRVKKMPTSEWPNFAPRMVSILVASLWELGKREEALSYMQEGIRLFPWFTDFKKRYADMLILNSQFRAAIETLMECRKQGDTQLGLIEFLEGAGTYLAAYSLGVAWAHVGDEMNARKWFLQSFFENPAQDNTLLPIIGLLPKDPKLLREFIEPRLYDPTAFATYVEIYSGWNYEDADRLIDQLEKKYGESEASHRAHMSLLRLEGTEALHKRAQTVNYDIDWLLLGIHYLELGDKEQANYALSRAKVRGEYLLKVMTSLENSPDSTWGLHGVIRDLIAMNPTTLLQKWLPRAMDIETFWITLKCSPLKSMLETITWPGKTAHECEQNALNHFNQKNYREASKWLTRAQQFEKTVTQFLLECDLALAENDLPKARKTIFDGKKLYPDSEMLKIASDQIHPKLNPLEITQKLGSGMQ
ncbi:glycosyltransferase family 2 protein [Sulfoacidibacillus thermotolerans]|nr:glycosyltransferase family 2 protein [Sulfoacidibacillus thermotolerans]